MVKTCLIKGCGNTKSNSNVTLHELPKDLTARNNWLEEIEKNGGYRHGLKKIGGTATVCSNHFNESSYETSILGKKLLSRNALPSIFVIPDAVQMPPTKKKKADKMNNVPSKPIPGESHLYIKL